MIRGLCLFCFMLILTGGSAFAQYDDIWIDSNGNITTGVNAGSNLEVTGASAEKAISGIAFGSGGTGVSGIHLTGGAILESTGMLGLDQTGVFGYGLNWAGHFQGNVWITNDLTVDGTITGLDATYVNEGQTGSITSLMLLDGTVAPADVSFNYAGSLTKGGAAADLGCTACVSIGELDFTPSLPSHDHNTAYVNVSGDTMTGDLSVNSTFINTTGEYRIDNVGVLKATSTNTFVGRNSGTAITLGANNTFVGRASGFVNDTGGENTFIGNAAGLDNDEGKQNTFIGYSAGIHNQRGYYNVFLGVSAGGANYRGHYNTSIGFQSGTTNNGYSSNNVFIGANSGYNESGSYRLHIDSMSNSFPLIYGEFDNKIIAFNAKAGIGIQNPSYQMHVIDGTDLNDDPAIYGEHAVTDYYGIGVKGVGLYRGVEGSVSATGTESYYGVTGSASTSGAGTTYGVQGTALGGIGSTNYGIYGSASGGSLNYAGYFYGDLTTTGYTQLALTAGSPPAADCDAPVELGRMKVDNANGLLYICVDTGWVAK